jgi:hypothetical protein
MSLRELDAATLLRLVGQPGSRDQLRRWAAARASYS